MTFDANKHECEIILRKFGASENFPIAISGLNR